MLLPLSRITAPRQSEVIIAMHRQQPVTHTQFSASVAALVQQLQQYPQKQRWGLYCEDALPFAVAFFALLHSGRQIVIPGNLTAATREKLTAYVDGLISDQHDADLTPSVDAQADASALPVVNAAISTVTIFTSGSTGEPKAIVKQLSQFEHELASLQQCWGEQLADARVMATVSHQHIYGLLFRVLWPLATGRIFYSEQALDNGLIHHEASHSPQKLVWIASPAHLKRLYEGLDWPVLTHRIARIFSSGGPLPAEAAQQVLQLLGQAPTEVFGSSETGGIAWRQQQQGNLLWQVLPGVDIQVDTEQRLQVRSAHIHTDGSWYSTDDAATLQTDGRFELLGRLDRIVKLEEKRLSLVELEQAIIASRWVSEVYCWVLPPAEGRVRQTLTATLVLNDEGSAMLAAHGRQSLIKQLKQHLQQTFELSLVPRKWRFVEQLPMNAQAKIDRLAIEKLMSHDAHT